jgi:hypothetical protein
MGSVQQMTLRSASERSATAAREQGDGAGVDLIGRIRLTVREPCR